MKLHHATTLALFVAGMSATAHGQAVIVDHRHVDASAIPDGAVAAAAGADLLVRHASVGGNINGGLDALQSADGKYDRSQWVFENRGNPGWQAKVDDLDTQVAARHANFDVMTMKFCYIDSSADFAYYRDHMEALEANPTYAGTTFVWWTMPIQTSANSARQAFNDAVRAYALEHGKILFDIAAIESHNAAGDIRLDGSGREIMWDEWTSDGGHLSSAGAQRVASGWWWLMARVAGWTPGATTHTLSVSKLGTGSGSVASDPAGIDCGASCSAGFAADTPVTLEATPDVGSTFVEWGGTCSGSAAICSVTMSADQSVSATFALLPEIAIVDASATETDGGTTVITFDVSLTAP